MIFKRKYFAIPDLSLFYCGILFLVKASTTLVLNPSTPYNVPMASIDNELDDAPEGYYAFIESPKMEPPQVKLPPYIKLNRPCQTIGKRISNTQHTWGRTLHNLCGDLNKGAVPMNPMNQNIYGAPYPFELIKNKTLEFFSKTLPILRANENIPKVTTSQAEPQYYLYQQPTNIKSQPPRRLKRDIQLTNNTKAEFRTAADKTIENSTNSNRRQSRKFCENDKGLMCAVYRLIQSQLFKSLVAQKRHDSPHLEYRTNADSTPTPMVDGPPTPCPAKVEYATPVFAKNYQGIWRYVVQIPYEGYFTQTIEVIKCINSKCHYMDGGCLSSPRWVSLLVAEIYYPETVVPINRRPQSHRNAVMNDDPLPLNDFSNYGHQYMHKRAVSPNKEPKHTKKTQCDGVDEVGCFQVRLYYDWFLVPGSCKCWRPDYFSKYIRWNHEYNNEL